MELEHGTCGDCGAGIIRVQIRGARQRVTLDASPTTRGIWRVYVHPETRQAEAWLRDESTHRTYYTAHDYTCPSTFQLTPMGGGRSAATR